MRAGRLPYPWSIVSEEAREGIRLATEVAWTKSTVKMWATWGALLLITGILVAFTFIHRNPAIPVWTLDLSLDSPATLDSLLDPSHVNSINTARTHAPCTHAVGTAKQAQLDFNGTCLQYAKHQANDVDRLRPGLRPLPLPELLKLQTDWPRGKTCEKPLGWPALVPTPTCKQPYLVAFKVANGVLSSSGPDKSANSMEVMNMVALYIKAFIEQMLLAIWLYKNLPDMQLLVNFMDTPHSCDIGMPVLQYSIINTTSHVSGEEFDVSIAHIMCPYLSPSAAVKDKQCTSYTRGWAIPTFDDWRHLSLSPSQLCSYSQCVQTRSSTHLQPGRNQTVFWRGTTTGETRGWSSKVTDAVLEKRNWGNYTLLASAVLNKRSFMVLQAAHYPWLDVGISQVHKDLFWLNKPKVIEVGDQLEALLTQKNPGFVDQDLWGRYGALQISIDGHGPPYRLPQQLLSGLPVAKVDSPMRSWFSNHLEPGVHYLPVRYDLADLPLATLHALHPTQSENLTNMATAAITLAMSQFSWSAQLDATVAAAMAASNACGWPTRPLEGAHEAERKLEEAKWVVLRLPADYQWLTPMFAHPGGQALRRRMQKDLPSNFLQDEGNGGK